MPSKPAKKRSKSVSPWKKAIRNILIILFVLGSVAAFAGTFFLNEFLKEASKTVQNLPELVQQSRGEPTTIVSSDNKVLLKLAVEYRKEVSIAEIPETVVKTTLAAEDIRFYEHRGVDAIALGRILLIESFSKGKTTGGSTLTMQLAKLMYTSSERTFDRKLRDMALAVQMEKLLTKDQILEFYLNTVYYGEGAYGVGAAADVYFGKKLEDLTLAEAALLSRAVRRPSDENPRANLDVAIRNRNVVLKILLDEEKITRSEYDEAVNEEVKLAPERVRFDGTTGKVSPYFVDYVLREVRRVLPDVDLKKGGYRIETTINQQLQGRVEREMNKTINGYRTIRTGAAIIVDRSGRVRAMFGGPSYKADQFNGASQGRRQPGSSFKTFVYLAAVQNGLVRTPYGSVDNSVVTYRENGRIKSPKGGGPKGMVPMKSAIASSYNNAAWHTLAKVGPANLVKALHEELGFVSEIPAVPSLALGAGSVSPLEMAQAYTVFPLKGRRATVFGVERIIGPNGLPVYGANPSLKQTKYSERTVDVIDECLRAVVTSGTGRAASSVKYARGKTGTTNDNKDAWFAGYTNEYVGIVWFANPIKTGKRVVYQEMGSSVMGGRVSAPAWAQIMRATQEILGEKAPVESGRDRSRYDDIDREEQRERRERSPDPDDTVTPVREPRPDREAPVVEPTTPEADPASAGGATTTAPATDPARTTPAPVNPPPREEGIRQETVTVEICAESGQRATVYCPERVTRSFPKGREPKGRCPLGHR